MKKKIFGFIIIITLGVISIFFINTLLSRENYKSPELTVMVPQEDLKASVFSIPTGDYIGRKEKITITVNGDIMFHGTQINNAYSNGKYNFDENFIKIKKYIQNADLALGNFETTTAGGQPSGYPVFNAPDETLTTLSSLGYDVLSTANNHCLDKGKNGIIRTISKINENNMINVGTYVEPGEHIEIIDIRGVKLSILSYTYGLNGMDSLLSNSEREYMVNLIDKDKIKSDIYKSEEMGVDFTIVLIHWGNEYQLTPSSYQRELANDMFNWGADIILGSHPHVIQESKIVEKDGKAKYVIYSMGNFISNQRRETLSSIENRVYTEDGVIVNITLEKDFLYDESKLVSVNYIPTWVYRYGNSGSYNYEVLPIRETLNSSNQLDNTTINKLRQSYIHTMTKMKLYKDFGGRNGKIYEND
ncbi:MAG: CapA family protein [Eubacteriaceae bacterium]